MITDYKNNQLILDISNQSPSGIPLFLSGKKTKLSSIFADHNDFKNAVKVLESIINHTKECHAKNTLAEVALVLATFQYQDQQYPAIYQNISCQKNSTNDDYYVQLTNIIYVNRCITKLLNDSSKNINTRVVLHNKSNADIDAVLQTLIQNVRENVLFEECSFVMPYIESEFDGLRFNSSHSEIDENFSETDENLTNVSGSNVQNDLNFDTLNNSFVTDKSYDLISKLNDSDELYRIPDISPEIECGISDLPHNVRLLMSSLDQKNSFAVDTVLNAYKYQTISALLVQLFCLNEKVAFISDANASFNVVHHELKKHKLNNILINASAMPNYDAQINKQLQNILKAVDVVNVDIDKVKKLQQLSTAVKAIFNFYAKPQKPWNFSYSYVLEQIQLYSHNYKIQSVFSHDTTFEVLENVDEITKNIKKLSSLRNSFSSLDEEFLKNINFDSKEDVLRAADALHRLIDISLPQLLIDINKICADLDTEVCQTLKQWYDLCDLLSNVRRTLDIFIPEVFQRDLVVLRGAFKTSDNKVSPWERRRLMKELKTLLRPGLKEENLQEQLENVIKQKELWIAFIGGDLRPEFIAQRVTVSIPASTMQVISLTNAVKIDLESIESSFGVDLINMPLIDVSSKLADFMSHMDEISNIPKYNILTENLASSGLLEFANELVNNNVDERDYRNVILRTYYSSVKDQMLSINPNIKKIDTNMVDFYISKFKQLDTDQIETLSAPAKYIWNSKISNFLKQHRGFTKQFTDLTDISYFEDFCSFVKQAQNLYNHISPVIFTTFELFDKICDKSFVYDTLVIDITKSADYQNIIKVAKNAKRVILVTDMSANIELSANISKFLPILQLDKPFELDFSIGERLKVNGYPFLQFGQVPSLPAKISAIKTTDIFKEMLSYINDLIYQKSDFNNISIVFDRSEDLKKLKGILRDKICQDESYRNLLNINLQKISFANYSDSALCESDLVIFACEDDSENLLEKICRGFFISTVKKRLIILGKTANHEFIENIKSSSSLADYRKSTKKPSKLLSTFASSIVVKTGGEIDFGYKIESNDLFRIPLVVRNVAKNINIAILIDDANFNKIKSLRTKLRHFPRHLETLGWRVLNISVAGLEKNYEIELAKVVDLYNENLFTNISKQKSNDKLSARDRNIIAQKPPHWEA